MRYFEVTARKMKIFKKTENKKKPWKCKTKESIDIMGFFLMIWHEYYLMHKVR